MFYPRFSESCIFRISVQTVLLAIFVLGMAFILQIMPPSCDSHPDLPLPFFHRCDIMYWEKLTIAVGQPE